MLYRLSTIIIFFYVIFFVKQRRKERNISVFLELSAALRYNDYRMSKRLFSFRQADFIGFCIIKFQKI